MSAPYQSLPLSRRTFLGKLGAGFGSLGLAGVLADAAPAPLDPKPPHTPPRAKRVIQLFMPGGPSHVDTFDYKPAINQHAGQRPKEVDYKSLRNTKGGLLPTPYSFSRYGESGKWVSDIFPHVAECVDDICFVHSMHTDTPEHASGILMMNLGHLQPIRPSMGAWTVYGLGSENRNLPGFVSMSPGGYARGGLANWGNSFLPGAYSGSYIDIRKKDPKQMIGNLTNAKLTGKAQRHQLELWKNLNQLHLEQIEQDQALEAGIRGMEMAFNMQFSVPGIFDLSDESPATLALYGKSDFARGCLYARRMAEQGVRFIQLNHSNNIPWDSGHNEIDKGHRSLAKQCDQGIAALLKDLKQRGMLEDTLVVWGGEFGRAPTSEGTKGRDHNHYGFTVWLAGGGVQSGLSYGATDQFGLRAMENRVHVHDLHATILHCLGINHEKLTYRYSGRDYRLTDVHGHVVHDILA